MVIIPTVFRGEGEVLPQNNILSEYLTGPLWNELLSHFPGWGQSVFLSIWVLRAAWKPVSPDSLCSEVLQRHCLYWHQWGCVSGVSLRRSVMAILSTAPPMMRCGSPCWKRYLPQPFIHSVNSSSGLLCFRQCPRHPAQNTPSSGWRLLALPALCTDRPAPQLPRQQLDD